MQLIVIVGAPRSGTSLLQNLITSHPDIASAPETHFFAHATPALLYERGLPPIGKGHLRTTIPYDQALQLMTRLTRAMSLDRLASDWFPAAHNTSGNAPLALRKLAESFFEHLAQGAPIFLEKSPPHAFFIPEIRHLFPDARFIHIVRDPRDVVASINGMLRQQGKQPRSTYERTRIWKHAVACAGREQLFTVRYEDLVTDETATMRALFAHLALPFDASRLQHAHEAASQTTRAKESWKANNFSATSPAMIGKFRTTLSTREILEVERFCGREMAQLGYEPAYPETPCRLPIREIAAYYGMRGSHLTAALLQHLRTQR